MRTDGGATPVHDYWLYVYDQEGRLIGPPTAISAHDDETAITRAKARLDGLDAELMDGKRLVERLPRKR
jgi:hypothetical protein